MRTRGPGEWQENYQAQRSTSIRIRLLINVSKLNVAYGLGIRVRGVFVPRLGHGHRIYKRWTHLSGYLKNSAKLC